MKGDWLGRLHAPRCTAPIRGLDSALQAVWLLAASASPLCQAQWGALPFLSCSALSALAQRYGQEDDKDGDQKHHCSHNDECFSHGTLPLLGAHCNAFWAPLVNFPGENHSLYEKAVAYPFFHINKEFISVCSISFPSCAWAFPISKYIPQVIAKDLPQGEECTVLFD